MKRKIFCLFAHPRPRDSKIHRELRRVVENNPQVIFRDLYELYPDFFIDVAKEQKLLQECDVIIVQHPLYWYSVPSLVKEWIDQVLVSGFAHGPEGDFLKDKLWIQVISCGGEEKNYSEDGPSDLRRYLFPIEQTAIYCSMEVLSPFVIYDAMQITHLELEKKVREYGQLVDQLIQGKRRA